ncbi:hypothetical protein HYN56_09760 [Flavobacterium crocinum]|uniref:T9SS C-terminal target domain-containing protein n=1 Tax=Flavobacterium crocinum TaxID=2183896 RepID=A0A2S1YKD9_9FLAO|nr:T9SS sorting signal type C domain-containing protein [Flavobacterium crocinum]AWK04502.1 hypothetical protein HYN56_09760 [Flavobacterium crocinum]
MKKLYLSHVLLFTVQLLFLLYPVTAQYAAGTPQRSFDNLKSLFPKSNSLMLEDRHRVWLNLTNTEGIFKQLLIGYIAGATNGWDSSFDAVSLDGNKLADFYSINSNKKLAIQGRALPLEITDKIPLGYRSAVTGNLTISIDHADGDLANQDIYILDKKNNTTHNLRNGGYTFFTQTGTFNDRFEMRYQADQKLGIDEIGSLTQELTVISKNKIISVNSRDTLLKEVSVFDITGKLLHNSRRIDTFNLEINDIQSGTQIVLVKTTLENGNIITKKVIF